jgi:hypothetical protein
MIEQISPNERAVPAHLPPSPERVVNVEIDELILDGFGPLDSPPGHWRPANSRRPDSRPVSGRLNSAPLDSARMNSARMNSAHAAEAFRRELARELADTMTGPAAEQLATAIADAVFRQLAAQQQRGGAR